MITAQDLLDKLGEEAWSGFNADDMDFTSDDSKVARRLLNRAVRYLLTLQDFPFRKKIQSFTTDTNSEYYKSVNGQIFKIYNTENYKELKFVGDISEYNQQLGGEPTHYWIEQNNPTQKLRLYPIPDRSYEYNIIYNSFQPIISKDGKTKKYKFEDAEDYLNIPPNIEDVFADCLVLRTIITNNKDEQDENYQPTINEFNEHWNLFKRLSKPTKLVKRVVL